MRSCTSPLMTSRSATSSDSAKPIRSGTADPGSLGEGGGEIVAGGTTTMPGRSTEYTVDLTAGPYYFVCMYNSLENVNYGGGITVEP